MINYRKMSEREKSVIIMIVDLLISIIAPCMAGRACFEPEDLLYNESDTAKVGVTSSGGERVFSYGPYIDLKSGHYKITICYESSEDTSFDVVCDMAANTLDRGELSKNKKQVTDVIDCSDVENFEVRTYYKGVGYLKINQILVQRCYVINYYVIVIFAIAVLGFLWVHKGIDKTILHRPKEVAYYALLYIVLFLFTLFGIHNKTNPFTVICVLGMILFHAYGTKMKIYEGFSYVFLMNAFSYIYLILLFRSLDIILRFTTSGSTLISSQTDIQDYYSLRIIVILILILSVISNLCLKRILFSIIYFLLTIVLFVQILYYHFFGRLFSFAEIKLAKEGSAYMDYIASLLSVKIVGIFIILIMAGILGAYLIKYMRRIRIEIFMVMLAAVVIIHLYLEPFYKGEYGEWNSFQNDSYIYQSMSNRLRVFELCGFYQYELKDIKKTLLKNTAQKKEMEKDIKYFFEDRNSLDDMGGNEWTGLFRDKNVLFFLMESIDDIACKPDVMPTLYKMQQEGINFTNMYASIFGSAATLNSEFVTNVGLYAPASGEPIYSFDGNSYPYSLASCFSDNGYQARQFHFNVPSYYMRDNMNRAFGYQEYICYADYAPGYNIMDDTVLGEADELYKKLVEYDRFLNYIITYSAHLDYFATDGLVVAALQRHPELGQLTGSDEINNYFAKARMTDDMLAKVISRLDTDGLLDDTIIICIGDHYPYGINDKETLYQLSGVERYEQLLYKVPCIIWGKDVNAAKIEKVTSSVDLLPTIVNLFDLGDTSYYLGHDILDDSYDGMAYFPDGSWITNNCYYYEGNFVYGAADENEINRMNKLVMDLIETNDKILMSDYYK